MPSVTRTRTATLGVTVAAALQLTLPLQLSAQAPPNSAASPEGTIGGVIEQLGRGSRSAPPSPSEVEPRDYSPKARVSLERGLRVFYDSRQHAEGIRHIEEALRTDPRSPRAYQALFIYYVYVRRDPAAVVAPLERGLRHCPASASVRDHLGNTYSAMGNHQAALAQFVSAVALEQSNTGRASLFFNVGNEHQRLGSLRQAVSAWETALGHDPLHHQARRHLVIGYRELGDAAAARTAAKRLIELDPTGEAGSWARAALPKL